MPDPFVVGLTGLPRYSYPDWRAAGVQRWRVAYGDAADTSPETPDGLLIDTITLETHQVGEGVQSCYGNSFVRTAEGVSLDLHLATFGRSRLAAEPTTVDAVWWGDPSTVVWNGVGVGPGLSVDATGMGNGDRYLVTEAGTIPAPEDPGALAVLQILVSTTGHYYGLEFDGGLSVIAAAVSDDPLETAELVAAEIVSVTGFTATAWSDGSTGAIVIVEGSTSTVLIVSGDTDDPAEVALYGGVRLATEAEDTGAQQVLAGTLTEITTPAAGLEGVINTEDGDLGRDVETDSAFRARHFDQINVGGRGTPARIRAALLDQDPTDRAALDLEAVRVLNNYRDEEATIEGRTIPAHAFEVILLGDALDADIGAVLFEQVPAGIRSYGETSVEVIDEVGGSNFVEFTRATELYLHLSITVTRGEGFPTTGDPAAAIVAAVVLDLGAVLTLGQNFYRERVRGVVSMLLDGVVTVTVTADTTPAPGDVPTLVGADITVAAYEILRVSSTRIAVVLA